MYYVPNTWIWKVYCLDRKSRPGTLILQDITFLIDLPNSRFKPTTSAKKVECYFQTKILSGSANVEIRELMEIWAGWVDSNGIWQKVQFGGYIIGLHGKGNATEHIILADLVDYSILTEKTTVFAWPTPLNIKPIAGYPPDFPVSAWISGRKGKDGPYDGVIRTHLDFIDYKIDPVFDDTILIAEAIPGIPIATPGNDYSLGQFGFTYLKAVIEDLANVSYYVNPSLRPSWWFTAVPNGRTVMPQFVLVDANDLSKPPRYTLATDADESIGEILISSNAEHSRDARSVQTLVTAKGRSDARLPGEESYDYIYAVAFNKDHQDTYPTYYQKAQPLDDGRTVIGWGGPPIDDSRIDTIKKAQDIADQVEEQVWGPIGQITGWIYNPLETGDIVLYRDTMEGLNGPIQIIDTDPDTNDGLFIYNYVAGYNPITIEDILSSGTSNFPLLSSGRGGRSGASSGIGGRAGGAGMHGAPRPTPIDGQPSGKNQNIIQSTDPSIPGTSHYPAINNDADPNSTVWAPQHVTHDTKGNVTDYHDGKTGTKAAEWHLSFSTNGTKFITFRSSYLIISQIMSDPTYNSGVSILYYLHKSGDPATTETIQATPTEFSAMKVGYGDKLRIVVTGVDRTVGLAVILSTIAAKHDQNGDPVL